MRAGDMEGAASFLEAALSLNVVILDGWRGAFGDEHQRKIDGMLQKVAKYRTAHPFVSSEPAADENVARILSRSQ